MAVVYRNIAGEESATVTFRVATVEIARGSTNEQQEILTLGDPQTSNALARVLASAPTSTEYGLGVRIISGPSSAVDLVIRPAFSSTHTDNPVRALWSSTLADNRATVYQSSAADLLVRPVFSSTHTDNPVRALWSSTQADNLATVYQSSAADLQMRPVFSSTGADNPVAVSALPANSSQVEVRNQVRVQNSTAGDFLVRPIFSSNGADNPVVISGNSTAVQGTYPWVIGGDTSAGATDSGNPVKIGGRASSAVPTAVAGGQRVNAMFDLWGRAYTRDGHQPLYAATFRGSHVPAERTKATVTQASAGAGKRNVVTGFTASFVATSTAPTAVGPITVSLIDGSAGGSTYLWQDQFSLPAVAGAKVTVTKANIWLPGGQASAITLEFGSSGGANTYQSVCFDGVICEE